MSSTYNIYDAFLYKYKKFILALTYTPGFNINYIIDDIIKTFNLKIIKLEGDSMLKSNSEFDYSKLNLDVNKLLTESDFKIKNNLPGFYGQGILIYGLSFPSKNIDFKIDLQMHFSNSATIFLKSFSDSNGISKYTIEEYNMFNDILSTNKIHKYFNLKTSPTSELNDNVFDKIIDFLEFKIYKKDYEKYATKLLKEKIKNNSQLTPLVNPKATDSLAVSEKNQLANEKYDELLTDTILSSVSDYFDADGRFPTKKSHTNYHIYKSMAKNIELSDAERNMSDMELLIGNEQKTNDISESDTNTDSKPSFISDLELDLRLDSDDNYTNTI